VATDLPRNLRPRRRADLAAFPVADEIVLVPRGGERVYALNQSGGAIWKLCDGEHTLADMLAELRVCYQGSDVEVLADVSEALLRFQTLNLVKAETPTLSAAPDGATVVVALADPQRPPVRFVYGIEDTVYFHWQLGILFESLVGQLPPGWEVVVVVCNDHAALSDDLVRLLDVYSVRHVTATNHRHSHAIDFTEGMHGYVALNRVEALKAIGAVVEPDDVVCLMDADTFLYGDLQVDLFPRGNAMAANWIVGQEKFFSFSANGADKGVDLQKLLASLGCTTPLKRGGVTVFLTGTTVANRKVIQDCFRFAQILYLLGKVADLPPHGVWIAEMACFAMALTPNGIDYDLLDIPQFSVQEPQTETVLPGSFFHYYADPNDGGPGPFFNSHWNKQLFTDRNFLFEDLDSFLASASSDPEKRFLELGRRARRRLYGTDAG
jgi:hypothetical protein